MPSYRLLTSVRSRECPITITTTTSTALEFDLEALAQQRMRRRSVLSAAGRRQRRAACASALMAPAGSWPKRSASSMRPRPPDRFPATAPTAAPGNTSNILTESGVVRSDIRSSFGISTNSAAGLPLTLKIKLGDAGNGCAALPGYAIYVWHCTQDGRYSLYTAPDENYLRGVQVADADGIVTFSTIFPGCYDGRWPHIHFEVYPSLDVATDHRNAVLTSQFALPADICREVYAGAAGYEASVSAFERISHRAATMCSATTATPR